MNESVNARVAGAPISWGVCEVPGWGHVLGVDTVLGEMAELGLRSTELGPPGFLPDDPRLLRAVLGRHGLNLVGAFLAVVLHEVDQVQASLTEAARACSQIAAAGGEVLVLAAATGLDGYDERPALTDQQWATLLDTCGQIRELAAEHGVRTTLHPHVGTHVERRDEVAAFLAGSDIDLCLDTGHLLIGGTDPLELTRAHPGRIAHVHLKDVDDALAARVRRGELNYMQGVQAGMYVPLGTGDVAVTEIVATLEEAGYQGWYVLEQDTALADGDGLAAQRPRQDTEASLRHLADAVR
jgi:inosose dehydratase